MQPQQMAIVALLLCCFATPVLTVLGVDVSQLFPTSTYQCIKKAGHSFAIPRGYRSYGSVDPNIINNLKNANEAGLIADMYMFHCRGKSGSAQVD